MVYLVDPQVVTVKACTCKIPKALYGIDPIYI